MDEPVLKNSRLPSGQESLPLLAEEPSGDSFLGAVQTIDPEAARRLRGHERTVQKVCSLVKEEAQARRLALLHTDVSPAWSYEYDKRAGIVIDVEVSPDTAPRRSSAITPSTSRILRSQRSARRGSWVTIKNAVPRS